MAGLKAYKAKLEQVISDFDTITDKVLDDNKQAYADENTRVLFNEGIDSQGNKLPEYSETTKRIKAKKGQPTNRMTLKDTGDFHRGFFARLSNGKMTISSKDDKTNELTGRYGQDIFGLQADDRRLVSREMVLPELIKELKQRL